MRYIYGRTPDDLNSNEGRRWLQDIATSRLYHRIHSDIAKTVSTGTALETIKSYDFLGSLLRNSTAEILFDVYGDVAANVASRFVYIYLNDVVVAEKEFTSAVAISTFSMRGAISVFTTGSNVYWGCTTILADDDPDPVTVDINTSLTTTVDSSTDLLTLAVKSDNAAAGDVSIYRFIVDYVPPPYS